MRGKIDPLIFMIVLLSSLAAAAYAIYNVQDFAPLGKMRFSDAVDPDPAFSSLEEKKEFDIYWKRGSRGDPFRPFKYPATAIIKPNVISSKPLPPPKLKPKPPPKPKPKPYELPVVLKAIDYDKKIILLEEKKTSLIHWVAVGDHIVVGNQDNIKFLTIANSGIILESNLGGRHNLFDPVKSNP